MPDLVKFKEGDLVQLRSGGPLMTVTDIDRRGMVTCVWFNPFEKESLSESEQAWEGPEFASFPGECLQRGNL